MKYEYVRYTGYTKVMFNQILLEYPDRCTLCEFLGRAGSKDNYRRCSVCTQEYDEFARNQELQDFLFGDVPQAQRGYTREIHGKVRVIYAMISSGNLNKKEGLANLTRIADDLQYPYKSRKAKEEKMRNPSKEAKRIQDYRLF